MKNLTMLTIFLTFFATFAYADSEKVAGQNTDSQVVYRSESQQSFKGPEKYFTGEVSVDMLFPSNDTAHYSGAYVTFQPGARTAWHLHPAGQHMIVTSGIALTGTRDGKIIEFKTGESVWCPPDIDHWHGATPDQAMTHLVITGALAGKNVVWKEKVTDEQYLGNVQKTSEENTMTINAQLNGKQRAIIPIAALTASGDLEKLKTALHEGLDAGLTVNEIKEILVQIYAYAGFPRSLNGLSTFMAVLDERKAKGIEDVIGEEASPIPNDLDKDKYGAKVRAMLAGQETDISGARWQLFTPVMDTFLKEHLFADIFARDVLTHRDRELATIATLANMSGTEGQLYFHLGAAMNTGLTETQIEDFISVLGSKVDKVQADRAQEVLDKVLNSRK